MISKKHNDPSRLHLLICFDCVASDTSSSMVSRDFPVTRSEWRSLNDAVSALHTTIVVLLIVILFFCIIQVGSFLYKFVVMRKKRLRRRALSLASCSKSQRRKKRGRSRSLSSNVVKKYKRRKLSGWREERMIPLLRDADERRSTKPRTRTKHKCITYDKLTLLPDTSISEKSAKTPKIPSSISGNGGLNNNGVNKASYEEWNAELLTVAEGSLETSLLQQSRSLSPTSCHGTALQRNQQWTDSTSRIPSNSDRLL